MKAPATALLVRRPLNSSVIALCGSPDTLLSRTRKPVIGIAIPSRACRSETSTVVTTSPQHGLPSLSKSPTVMEGISSLVNTLHPAAKIHGLPRQFPPLPTGSSEAEAVAPATGHAATTTEQKRRIRAAKLRCGARAIVEWRCSQGGVRRCWCALIVGRAPCASRRIASGRRRGCLAQRVASAGLMAGCARYCKPECTL